MATVSSKRTKVLVVTVSHGNEPDAWSLPKEAGEEFLEIRVHNGPGARMCAAQSGLGRVYLDNPGFLRSVKRAINDMSELPPWTVIQNADVRWLSLPDFDSVKGDIGSPRYSTESRVWFARWPLLSVILLSPFSASMVLLGIRRPSLRPSGASSRMQGGVPLHGSCFAMRTSELLRFFTQVPLPFLYTEEILIELFRRRSGLRMFESTSWLVEHDPGGTTPRSARRRLAHSWSLLLLGPRAIRLILRSTRRGVAE